MATLSEREDLNHELTELFRSKEKQGDQHRNPNKIGTQVGELFESTFDLFSWPDPPVRQLASECHTLLYHIVEKLNDYTKEEMDNLRFHYDAWFHITRHGGYQSIHYHPNASWSGIYCVSPGEKVDDRPESGAVKFYDPRAASFMHVDPGNDRLNAAFSGTPIYLNHKQGQLAIFPSWLMHEVLPYMGKSERVVVAFNSWVTRKERLRKPTQAPT